MNLLLYAYKESERNKWEKEMDENLEDLQGQRKISLISVRLHKNITWYIV